TSSDSTASDSTASDSTSSDSTTTTAPTPTTVLAPGDVAAEFHDWVQDAQQDALGIHTHGDGLIHIHPFTDAAAGVNANLGKFLDQTGMTLTNDTLKLPDGSTFTEGVTKCAGGKDGQLQVAKWNSAEDAAAGKNPNQIFTDGFDKIRLGASNVF